MRCISDELIQKYVDKETSVKENTIVASHLTTCSECADKIEERQKTANRIKQLVNSMHKEEIQVPRFQEPEHRKKNLFVRYNKVIYAASAACLIILFLVFPKRKDDIKIMYQYDIESEYNANLPLSEQQMVIEIYDSEGKLITY